MKSKWVASLEKEREYMPEQREREAVLPPPYIRASYFKRCFDIAMSILFIAGSAIVLVIIAIAIYIDSPGPILYRQTRVGVNERSGKRRYRNSRRGTERSLSRGRRHSYERRKEELYGKPFSILKFRTMTLDAEKGGPMWCREGDPRVTPVGRILRKTHLDELPQVFNILKGEMSVVGPRPERPEFVQVLTKEIPEFKQRLILKPGLTGLAQIRQRSDLEINDVKKKIKYDFLYLKNASFGTDLKIVVGTIPLMLGIPVEKLRKLQPKRWISAMPILNSWKKSVDLQPPVGVGRGD